MGEFLKTSTVNDFYIYDKIDATDDFFGATYFNLVIFTDWSLVEVEGVATLREDVQFDGSDGNLSILPLNVISAIDLHLGPVETVKSSARSMLVVLLDIIGSDRIFRYWHADTYEQYQELLNFSTALMEGIKTTSTA